MNKLSIIFLVIILVLLGIIFNHDKKKDLIREPSPIAVSYVSPAEVQKIFLTKEQMVSVYWMFEIILEKDANFKFSNINVRKIHTKMGAENSGKMCAIINEVPQSLANKVLSKGVSVFKKEDGENYTDVFDDHKGVVFQQNIEEFYWRCNLLKTELCSNISKVDNVMVLKYVSVENKTISVTKKDLLKSIRDPYSSESYKLDRKAILYEMNFCEYMMD